MTKKLPIDAIYVATSKNTKDRLPFIHHQLAAFKFNVPIHIRYAPESQLLRYALMKSVPMVGYVKDLEYSYQCTINHYLIYNEAKAIGYNRILVIEDDIRLMNDRSRFMKTLRELPKDADWAMLDWWAVRSATPWKSGSFNAYMQQHRDEHWVKWNDQFILRSTGAYMASQKGIQAFIDIQDSCMPGKPKFFWGNIFHAADELFDRQFMAQFNLNCYVANPILARQAENTRGRGGNSQLYSNASITSPEFNLQDYEWDFSQKEAKA